MGYIYLKKIRKLFLNDRIRLSCEITIFEKEKKINKELWYEVEADLNNYIYDDRVDPFLVAILPFCMMNSLDICVDENTGVSADLLFQLQELLIPTMSMAKKFNLIKLSAYPLKDKLSFGKEIATGISRGVDSFYTILKTMEGEYTKPTLLTLFNVQAYGEYGGEAANKMFQRDFKMAEQVCCELNDIYNTNLRVLTVISNIHEELPIKIYDAGSFRDAGAIVLLKQLIGVYFFSSTIPLDEFSINGSCREFEAWIFSCLSTYNQKIQPVGIDKKRIDKLRFISDYPITQRWLKVCRKPLIYGTDGRYFENDTNCTFLCEKCRATVLELMAIGRLENYNAVFDTKWVEKHKREFFYELIAHQNQHGELGFADIYHLMRENNIINDFMEVEAGYNLEIIDDAPLDRNFKILELMNLFFEKKQDGLDLKNVLKNCGYEKIGIYGMGRIGKILYRELRPMVQVQIDRKFQKNENMSFQRPDGNFSNLDLIIVTTVYKEEVLKKYLLQKSGCCNVMTLKEILLLDKNIGENLET